MWEGTRLGLKKFGENYNQANPPIPAAVRGRVRRLFAATAREIIHLLKIDMAGMIRGSFRAVMSAVCGLWKQSLGRSQCFPGKRWRSNHEGVDQLPQRSANRGPC